MQMVWVLSKRLVAAIIGREQQHQPSNGYTAKAKIDSQSDAQKSVALPEATLLLPKNLYLYGRSEKGCCHVDENEDTNR